MTPEIFISRAVATPGETDAFRDWGVEKAPIARVSGKEHPNHETKITHNCETAGIARPLLRVGTILATPPVGSANM